MNEANQPTEASDGLPLPDDPAKVAGMRAFLSIVDADGGSLQRAVRQQPHDNTQSLRQAELDWLGLALLSPKGMVREVNDRLCAMQEMARMELVGKPAESLLAPHECESFQGEFAGVRAKPAASTIFEAHYRRKPGHMTVMLKNLGHPNCKSAEVLALFLAHPRQETAEMEALNRERRFRDTLIREVHHRIKNNLQGVLGLLVNQTIRYPEVATLLEAPMRQINAISLTYGLRSETACDRIFLCELTRLAANSVAMLLADAPPIDIDIPFRHSILIVEGEAVSVALIINELVFNALKHGDLPDKQVQVSLRKESDHALVRVRNRGRLDNLDFSAGKGLGTGLQLVKSLLPQKAAALSIRNEKPYVITELQLRPPLLDLNPGSLE